MGAFDSWPDRNKEVKPKSSSREHHLLEALLHLLLYIGFSNNESDIIKKTRDLVFTSGTTPPTDYGRPRYPMGG